MVLFPSHDRSGGSPTANMPQLNSFEEAFRPFIQIKYLINRIFESTPFSYTSNFFDDADFEKLYMDFNWGDVPAPIVFNNSGTGLFTSLVSYTGTNNVI